MPKCLPPIGRCHRLNLCWDPTAGQETLQANTGVDFGADWEWPQRYFSGGLWNFLSAFLSHVKKTVKGLFLATHSPNRLQFRAGESHNYLLLKYLLACMVSVRSIDQK